METTAQHVIHAVNDRASLSEPLAPLTLSSHENFVGPCHKQLLPSLQTSLLWKMVEKMLGCLHFDFQPSTEGTERQQHSLKN